MGDDLQILGRYDKHHLVPFGEYMPFDKLAALIGFKTLVHVGDGFTPGPSPVALAVPGLPSVQPLICFEGLFPSSFARTGPRPAWIANISNDAWFGETSGPWQHLNLASYRAIEEGMPVVRATPTGVSAVVDAYGRPTALLGLGKAGVIDADLPPTLGPTLYSRWRDVPFWIFFAGGAMIAPGAGSGGHSFSRRCELAWIIGWLLMASDAINDRSPHPIDLHVGQRIRARRKEVRVSQETLAEQLGLTFQQVQKYEKGSNRVSASKLYDIARALSASIEYFFRGFPDGDGYAVREDDTQPFVHDFITTTEGQELVTQFSKIADPQVRKQVLDLIKSIARNQGAAAT